MSLYYVMMLAWVGCVADSAEVAARFGDDIASGPTVTRWISPGCP